MEFIRTFKLRDNNVKFTSSNISIICVGSAENRERITYTDEELDGVPDLIKSDGTIYEKMKEPSDFENIKKSIFEVIEKLSHQESNDFSYLTIDPAYTNNSKELDELNYRGHVSSLFHNLTIEKSEDCNFICVIGCYLDFFDNTNISKIMEILNKNNGYLLICDTVPYKTSPLFNTTFQQIN